MDGRGELECRSKRLNLLMDTNVGIMFIMNSRDLANYSGRAEDNADGLSVINWEEKFNELKLQYEELAREKENLEVELKQCRSQRSNTLPSKDELESISSMLDIINKLDEGTLNKIERLNRKQ